MSINYLLTHFLLRFASLSVELVLEINDILEKWSEELLIPKKNDVLVDAKDSSRSVPIGEYSSTVLLEETSSIRKLINEAKKERKLNGNDTLGISRFVVSFMINKKDYCCPVTIIPCTAEYSKWEKKFELTCQEEVEYTNPVLCKLFGVSAVSSKESILEELSNQKLEFDVSEVNLLANFHPHRFILLREIELIKEVESSANLLSFLGLGENVSDTFSLAPHNLVSANKEQNEVTELVQQENVVVQGPPGTGKSQVILNMIGKALAGNQTIALVSEKMAALDVIQKKLNDIGLHWYSQNLLSNHPKDFISSLKQTWSHLETGTFNSPSNQLISYLMLNQLDLKIERLQQKSLIGGLDFSTFLRKKPEIIDEPKLELNPIDIPDWEEQKIVLQRLEAKNFDLFGNWNKIQAIHLNSAESLDKLNEKSKEIKKLVNYLGAESWSVSELEFQMKKSALCSLFFQNDKEINVDLAKENSTKHKQFLKLSRQFSKLTDEVEFLQSENENWKKNLNLSEIQSFTDTLLEEDKWGIRKFSVKRKIKNLSKAPIAAAVKSLENLKRLKEAEDKLITCKDSLRKLNIEPDKTEIERLHFILSKIQNSDENVFTEINSLSKKEKFSLKNSSSDLQQLYHFFTKYFRENNNLVLKDKLNLIEDSLSDIIQQSKLISMLEVRTLDLLANNNSIKEIENVLYYSHFRRFQGLFPELANYNGEQLVNEINSISEQENNEFSNFGDTITYSIKQRFDSYEKLLQTPANKLNTEDKELKKQLRKGKAILVKEFGKSKQFWTPLQLMQSDAAIWIRALQPVVISTTYQLAANFPMQKELFDFVLIDEASQIVSSHAAGAIYRAKRVIIAGDQEQMAPSFLFQSDNDSSDALHQAQYNWKNVHLKHHYRSNHSALIEFSNKHFYNNELIVFPSPENSKKVIDVIKLDGTYADRKNEIEAKTVANWIEEQLKVKNVSFGVAAFSQSQLNCIRNNVSAEYCLELDELIEEGLLFKSIENIQGDECDDLIISLGYAKNEEGKFLLQMGPLNKENGHRRLNVLASRARKSITLVKSISSTDIPLSENEGVNMLRKMLSYFENASNSSSIKMPYGLDFEISGSKLILKSPHLLIESGRELFAVISTLTQRGWQIEIQL